MKVKFITDDMPTRESTQLSLSTKEFIAYIIIGLLVCTILLSVIHESGHAIAVLLFHGSVHEMAIFPAPIFTKDSASGGYIYWSIQNASVLQITIVAMMGSILTMIFGLTIFIIGFKLRLRPVIELWALLYAVIFILDIVTYILLDSIGGTMFSITDTAGDWYVVFDNYPFLQYIFIPIAVVLLIFLIRMLLHPKLFTRFTF